jgi:hypothetical protein
MGTRSRIGVMHGNKVKSIYCHWDGYLSHNGRILQEHYDSARANQLVALGDLSSLRPNIGEKHAFSPFDIDMSREEYDSQYGDMCLFYGRDRGEKGTEHKVNHTFAEFLEQCDLCGAEYYYIMENGQWYCGSTNERDPFYQRLVLLSDALESQTVDQ